MEIDGKIIFLLSDPHLKVAKFDCEFKKDLVPLCKPKVRQGQDQFLHSKFIFHEGAINVLVHYLLLVLHYQQGTLQVKYVNMMITDL